MKHLNTLMLSCLSVGACAAAPAIREGSVTIDQTSVNRVVVNYELQDESAIVTCDIRTNGVSIGEANLRFFAGDVNKKVGVGTHTLTWDARKAWPDHKITDKSVTAVVKAWSLQSPPDYMVLQLETGDVRYYTSEAALPEGAVTNDAYKTSKMAFRRCPAGNVEWRMGTDLNEYWGLDRDLKPRLVTLPSDFYMGVFPVTQAQFYKVRGTRPSEYKEADCDLHPVEHASWVDLRKCAVTSWPEGGHEDVGADGFIGLLRTRVGGGMFDLPLEAQWEFAARAGCSAELYDGNRIDNYLTSENLKKLGAHKTGHTMPVGSYLPNAWGFYDMLGNVYEWCLDRNNGNDLTGVDPATGPTSGKTDRVYRGGSFKHNAFECLVCSHASCFAEGRDGAIGFRLACGVGKDLP